MSEHSIFSPSASDRILHCPPSLKLCADLPEQPSAYAAEGTAAHAVCAWLVESALGRDVEDPTENLDYYNAEMRTHAESYAAFVMEKYEKADTGSAALMLVDYARLMGRYTDFAEKLDAMDESDYTKAEWAYYIEVTNRVNQKLLKALG